MKYAVCKIIRDHSLSNKKLKINSWVHIFKKGQQVALYNPLNQEVVYGDEYLEDLFYYFKLPNKPSDLNLDNYQIKTLKDMVDLDIIVNETFDEQKELEQLQEAVRKKFQIDLMYLVLSTACNYDCNYCFVTKDDYKLNSKLDKKTITNSIDLFLRFMPKEASSGKIVIYGGEPLLNEDLIRFVIGEEGNRVKSLKNIDIDFEMITNGSLVTKDFAAFLANNNANVSVSLDGWEDIHNKQRKKPGGGGTFRESIRGFQFLKEAGCAPGISCTISHHNIDKLDKIVSYFADNLQPSAIGINPQLKDEFSPPAEHVAHKLIQAFKVARSIGLYEDRIMKLLQPFVGKYIRMADCGACGNQIVIDPEGKVGVCPAFLGDERFFPGQICSNGFNPYREELFLEWSRRATFNIDQCRNCYAITICGGGCPYLAFQDNKTIWKPNEANCILARTVLEWAIWDAVGMDN